MARYAEGSIADVDLVDTNSLPLRVDVLDGEAFRGAALASSVMALDQTVHTQVTATALKGMKFGCKLYQCPVQVLDDIVAAMEVAVLAGESFAVNLFDTDGVDNIEVMAVIDYAALGGKSYTRGSFSGAYVRDVTFRFISTGPIV